jgi:hypothetical protein
MNGPSVEFKGWPEASADLHRWAAELGTAFAHGIVPFADTVADRAAAKMPVLTGTLASAVEVVDAGGAQHGAGVGIADDIPYAGWIEFGGSRGRALIPEGRYLYPTAVEAGDTDFERAAAEVADDTTKRFPWSTPPL